ncbi:MAG: SBBP repeat-containing protein, partial [Bacteroidetes bacterium]|nr:SBBP repeat-containing protein [Bacteroidota bacterium]
MKKLIVFFFFSQSVFAQTVNLEWVNSIGATSWDYGRSITTDNLGNVYVTGNFQGTADFDPGAGFFNLTSKGGWDIFIQKLNADGNLIWAKSIGGTLDDFGNSITTDAFGNVYVTGQYQSVVDFDPSAATFNLTSIGSYDVFIQKLDGDGDFVWAISNKGTSADFGVYITTDASGNVYATGNFQGTVDFDPGPGIFNLTSNGGGDVFIQKLDAGGNFVWAISMGGTSGDMGNSITFDTFGNAYVTGKYQGTVDFDPGLGIFNLTSNGSFDIFIQKLNINGNLIWAKSIGSTSNDIGWFITSDALGNLYVTGYFSGTVDFDPGAGIFNLTSVGQQDIFVQKLDAAGNIIWAKSIGGAADDEGYAITTDASSNVFITGYYNGTVDFDPSVETFNLTSNGQQDIFVQMLNDNGDFVWAESIGGTTDSDRGNSITTDTLGNLYVTGFYEGTVDFDPGTEIFNLTSNGSADIFILKLCLNAPNVTVTITDPSITANATGASYQWLDCTNGYAIVSGETAQSFTASANGDYAVEVTTSGCTDTSVCITIFTVNIEENTLLNSASIFPNPNAGLVNVELGTLKGVS